MMAGQSLISAGTSTNEVVFDLWRSAHVCGLDRKRNGSIPLLLSDVPAWAWADFHPCDTYGSNLWSPQEFGVERNTEVAFRATALPGLVDGKRKMHVMHPGKL